MTLVVRISRGLHARLVRHARRHRTTAPALVRSWIEDELGERAPARPLKIPRDEARQACPEAGCAFSCPATSRDWVAAHQLDHHYKRSQALAQEHL